MSENTTNTNVIDTPKVDEFPVHSCMIPRRGKGAKGFVEVQTFGVPVKVDKETGVPSDWDYSSFRNLSETKMFDIASRFAGKINIAEALFRGIDAMLKSANMQANSKAGMLYDYIVENGLAQDETDAKNLANVWKQTIAFMTKSGMDEPTVQELHDSRTVAINRMKAAGSWKSTYTNEVPALVKDGEQVNQETETPVAVPVQQ